MHGWWVITRISGYCSNGKAMGLWWERDKRDAGMQARFLSWVVVTWLITLQFTKLYIYVLCTFWVLYFTIKRFKSRKKKVAMSLVMENLENKQIKRFWNSRSHPQMTRGFEIRSQIVYMWYHHKKPCKSTEDVLNKLLLDEWV